jgi:hypothetical protein
VWQVYDAQNIAIITNAVARVERRDVPLMLHLSYMAQQMHPDQVSIYNGLY